MATLQKSFGLHLALRDVLKEWPVSRFESGQGTNTGVFPGKGESQSYALTTPRVEILVRPNQDCSDLRNCAKHRDDESESWA